MTFPDLVLSTDTDDTSTDFELTKDKIRNAVKTAARLYNEDKISKELFQMLAELALVYEIEESFEKKISKKGKKHKSLSLF